MRVGQPHRPGASEKADAKRWPVGSAPRRAGLTMMSLLVSALLLTACGGEGPTDARVADSSPAARARALAVEGDASSTPIDTATLFNWAERQYPSLFPQGPVNEPLVYDGTAYTIRYYASTGNYLAVSDGKVFGYGPFTGNQLQGFGFTADYTCSASPTNCKPATGVAMAWDSGGKAWDGSDWQ